MADLDNNIEKFIGKLYEIQNSEISTRLTENDLQSIAYDVGLSEGEWNNILKIFDDHTVRGKAFLDFQNYDDAIKEFGQALTIMPHHVNTLYQFALAHKMRFRQTNNSADKKKALEYATLCAQIEPTHTEAIKLISSIKAKPMAMGNAPKSKMRWVVLGGLIVLVALFIIFLSIKSEDSIKYSNSSEISNSEDMDIPKAIENDDYLEEQPEQDELTKQLEQPLIADEKPEIKIVFVENHKSKGLKFDVQTSEFKDYTTSYSYNIRAYLTPFSIEISALNIKIDLVDINNKVVKTEIKSVVDKNYGAVRPNDLIPFEYLHYQKTEKIPQLKEVRVSVEYVENQLVNFEYEASEAREFEWAYERPANFNIEIKERFNRYQSGFSNSCYHNVEWEVKNTGNRDIQLLKFSVSWFDKKGKQVGIADHYICGTSDPKIQRGQTRVSKRTFGIENCTMENIGTYKIKVVDLN